MKRDGSLFLVLGILFVVLSLSVVSANIFSDMWGKITGQPVKTISSDGVFKGGSEATSTPYCTDSDGGLNYIVKGTVYGQDSNSTNYFINDSCSSGVSLKEYYCANTTYFYSNYNCANLGANYVCSNGACVLSSACTNVEVCTDALDNNCNGFTDCADSSCSSNPSCLSGNQTCTSSSQCPSSSSWYCASSTQACTNTTSYSCISGQCVISGGGHGCATCPYGCSNGACIENNQTNTTSYFDLATTAITFSDNTPEVGQLIIITKAVKNLGSVNGYVTGGTFSTCLIGSGDGSSCPSGAWGSSNGGLILAGETKYYYENYSFNKAGTWELKRSYNGKGVHNESDINLGNNLKTVYVNVSGSATITCNDSDNGINYYTSGSVAVCSSGPQGGSCVSIPDTCYGSDLTEYSCSGTELRQSGMFCGADGGSCVNGACVQSQNQTNLTCIDSDGGLNYYVKGTLQNWLNTTLEDYCLDGNNLIERYCTSDPNVFTQQYSCSNGCYDGACVQNNQTTLSCSDSDGGWYPYARGTVTIGSAPELRYTDFCLVNGTNNTLHEYTCSGDNTLGGENFLCPYGCLNGVCKTKSNSGCSFFGRIFKSAACKVVAEKDKGSDLNN